MTSATPHRLKLLILGLNYAPEMVGIGVYTAGVAEALCRAGHDVQVVAGQPYYPQWKQFEGFPAWRWTTATESGVKVTRCPHYIPGQPTGARRLLHHLSFAATALIPTVVGALRQRPDVVIAIAPSLIAAPVAKLAGLVCGARTWLHVQDFEVEAAAATRLLRQGRILTAARWFERKAMRAFDRVSSISSKMCEKLAEKGVPKDNIVQLRNWAETDVVVPLKRPSTYRSEWNITPRHVALYSGNIANKQGIDIIVEAARTLAHRPDLMFVVCGEGPNRGALEDKAQGLSNVQFHDLQPKDKLNELLGLATVHLIPQLAGAADLVLPSKLGNMLASGRPIVATAAKGTGLAEEVEGCGIVVEPGNVRAFAAAIETLIEDRVTGALARSRAEQRWSKSAVMAGLNKELAALTQLRDRPVGTRRRDH